MKIPIALTDAATIRAIADDPSIESVQLFPGTPDGHKYAMGETRTLAGLVDFPEFNGQQVKIVGLRQSFDKRKAYYVEGEINKFLNWVFESRLV